MKKPIIIFGAKGRGKIIAHILEQNDLLSYGFLDDDPKLVDKSLHHLPILGKTNTQEFLDLLHEKCLPFIALQDKVHYQRVRELIRTTNSDLQLINAIHPQAIIAKHIRLGEGNCIQACAYVGPDVIISSHSTIAPHVLIEHSSVLHDFVTIGAGAKIGAHVEIQENVTIGAGAIIASNITIGENTQISAGAIIEKSLPANTVH